MPSEAPMNRVGFWRRVLAAVVDVALFAPVALLFLVIEGYVRIWSEIGRAGVRVYQLTTPVLLLVYFSFEFGMAASAGKLLTRLEIRNIDGSEASMATLVHRWTTKWSFVLVAIVAILLNQPLLAWLSNLLGLLVFLGCFAAAGESRLAWHDRWAKTAVFRVRDVRSQRGFDPVLSESEPEDATTTVRS